MKFDAKHLRKEYHKQLRQDLMVIVNIHLKRIHNYIKLYKSDEMYTYTVDSYISGYKSYNPNTNGQVYKHIIKEIQKEGYKIKKIEPNKILISWKHKHDEAYQKYIASLLINIFKCVKHATMNKETDISYTIPINVIYQMDKMCADITDVLVKKNFKVYQRDTTLLIKW